ncbi:MAG: hypothetical protein COW01_10080 [Bdellovibrionales bacterium CG12_big_fil_rev_8_21_14_0_65_38_15]|nr:MAG: hypothetical protein COW79_06925 [Bdellovibrionales bacterium CG22_combo_CG10-13_8_21_14_all_38_13]PIQ54484.1 MAG: hypothetical protein COW01_10080 [Bdellovibrionales bacterium CG12_big_fil_rev_8_21_14_0_65_38_15]PIR29865.1 MAG: hypothetical protein COV38_07925 [Bdellovibrionales bacterium CG11_big_fil_rev_8_21_14_0_20_38_13]
MKLFTLLIMAFTFNLNAQVDPNASLRGAGSAPSGTCHNCTTDNDHEISGLSLPTTRPRRGSRPYFNPACQSFIKADGSYGEWGKYITDYISGNEKRKNDFFSNAILGMESAPKTCPNWGTLSEAAKMKFWVWMMSSIAQVESSCDPRQINLDRNVPDIYNRPVGLFQLNEKNSRTKPRRWRGDNCNFPDGTEATMDPRNNTLCAIGIMYHYVKSPRGQYSSQRKIFPTNSYWEKLRSGTGGPIGQLIRQYPPCGATP